jgi:predicted trehalose synthase
MTAELDHALAVVPGLAAHEAAVRVCYADLARLPGKVRAQRIHGDYHLAQVLGTGGAGSAGNDPPMPPRGVSPGGDDPPEPPRRWVVLDFEGEPSVPLARRRAYAPALRDVAGMLRSFDYAARHEALRHPDDPRLAEAASAWLARCQDAFCCGYAKVMGDDPRATGPLLRALTLQKAVYEAVYEARHRPDWLPMPLAAIAEVSR